jgi:hypothetical protein
MDIDLRDYTAGGYFITKLGKRRYSSPELLPERLFSISGCHGNIFPVYFGWKADFDHTYALDFGISAEKLPAFAKWSFDRRGTNIGYPDVFYTLDAAKEFIVEFLPSAEDLLLIGIGLHTTLVEDFLNISNKEKAQFLPSSQSTNLFELNPLELFGVNRALNERQFLAQGGSVLGYDIASYGVVRFVCSWLCVCAEYYMDEELGVRPNSFGLIPTFETAIKVSEHVKRNNTEPTAEYPWLIVQYHLE